MFRLLRAIPIGPLVVLAGTLPAASGAAPVASAASEGAWRSSFEPRRADLASTGSNLYFPLEPGRRLHYEHGKETLVISVLDATKRVDDVETRIVEEREEKSGHLTEVSRNYFAIDRSTRDVYYFGEDSDEYADGKVVGTEGSWLAGVGGAKFGLIMPGEVKLGDRFYQELAPKIAMDRAEIVATDERVETPAGTFDHCLHVRETSPLERGGSDKWYAPNVGLIRDDDLVLAKIEPPPARAAVTAAGFDVTALGLPGAPADGVALDYLVIDSARHRVWVPAGGTGSVDVIDTRTAEIRRIPDFPTAEWEHRGRKHRIGPSSATVGDGFVYVGNRGDFSVCAVDAGALKRSGCAVLPSMPDGVVYVARTKEVWVTTPRARSIVILDVSKAASPRIAGHLKLEGEPEGYAVDDTRGLFYTNLEDADRTLRIDVATRKVTATWKPGCGEDGPRGLAVEPGGRWVMVACPDHVSVLDANDGGAISSRLDTGGGVDAIAYLASRRRLWIASAATATLTVAQLDEHGVLGRVASTATAPGARNAVVTDDGVAYVAAGRAGKVLVVRRTGGD